MQPIPKEHQSPFLENFGITTLQVETQLSIKCIPYSEQTSAIVEEYLVDQTSEAIEVISAHR